MKKFLSIVLTIALALTMVFAITSCSEKEPTIEEIYDAAYKKYSEVDAVDMDVKMTMGISAQGVSMDMPVEYAIKATGIKSGKLQMSGVVKTSLMGISLEIPVYTDGEYVYVSMMGEKVKQPVNESDYNTEIVFDTVKEIDSSVFENATLTKKEDGSKVIELVYDEETFKKVFDDLISSSMKGLGVDESEISENVKYRISNMKQIVTVNSNNDFTSVTGSFDIDIEITDDCETESAKITTTFESVFNSFGDDVKVEVPTDLDKYTENPDRS